MALSEDQRALLRLLLAGDTYERVAELLGTTQAEVRTRAHEAVDALEQEPDPETPPEAVRARLEAIEGTPAGVPIRARTPPPSAGGRRWTLWLIGGGAALVLIVVLLVVGGGGGGGGGDNTPTTGGGQEDAVPIRLSPVGGSTARGGLTIIRIGDQPAVDLDISGLAPSGGDQTYVLWFVGSGGRSLPVAFQAVGPDGRITGRTPIPSAAAGLLPSLDTADLTLTRRRQAAAAVKQAAQSGLLPQPVGISVMRGALRG
jgi:hypothetical protein